MPASATTSDRLVAETADRVRLSLWRFFPRGPGRAVCLLTHAMAAHGGYLRARLAPYLAGRGIDTFVLDWRGHGGSVPPSASAGAGWSFDDYVRLDLPAALAAVGERAGCRQDEIAYAGHSLGGLVGLAGAVTGRLVPPRMVLFATSLWLPGRGGSRGRRALLSAAAATARVLGRVPVRRLRLGTDDEPAAYVAQLAAWARSGRWMSEDGLDYEAGLGRVGCPVLALTGERDRLCRPKDAERFRGRLEGARPLRRVGRRFGDACDPDHFRLLTDGRLAPVWGEVARFLGGR